jgi:hypothetical protein
MTATADFMQGKTPAIEPARMVDGGRMLVRGAQRVAGAALLLSAIGIWLIPASVQHDVMLFRLMLSVAAAVAGVGMMLASGRPDMPAVQIDTIRREVSLVRPGYRGASAVLQRCTFGDLSRAEVDGTCVRLWDADERLIAEISLTKGPTLNSLLAGLRDAGKIA